MLYYVIARYDQAQRNSYSKNIFKTYSRYDNRWRNICEFVNPKELKHEVVATELNWL